MSILVAPRQEIEVPGLGRAPHTRDAVPWSRMVPDLYNNKFWLDSTGAFIGFDRRHKNESTYAIQNHALFPAFPLWDSDLGGSAYFPDYKVKDGTLFVNTGEHLVNPTSTTLLPAAAGSVSICLTLSGAIPATPAKYILYNRVGSGDRLYVRSDGTDAGIIQLWYDTGEVAGTDVAVEENQFLVISVAYDYPGNLVFMVNGVVVTQVASTSNAYTTNRIMAGLASSDSVPGVVHWAVYHRRKLSLDEQYQMWKNPFHMFKLR